MAGWLATHIYNHYAFEQSEFKKDFVVMNQKARQNATSLLKETFITCLRIVILKLTAAPILITVS